MDRAARMGAGEGGRGAGTKMSRGKGLPDDAEAKRRQNNVTTAAGERKGGGAGVGGTRATAAGSGRGLGEAMSRNSRTSPSDGILSESKPDGSDNISGSMRKWIKRVVNVVNGGDGGSGGLVPAGRSGTVIRGGRGNRRVSTQDRERDERPSPSPGESW